MGKFIADPGRVRQGGEMMADLPDRANKIRDDFVSDMQTYRPWAGYNDDFALQVRPKYDANNNACLEFLDSVGLVFSSLRQAVLNNAREIEGVQSYANEEIAKQQSRLEGPGGDSTGGGRH
ncbi:hypothetical protein ABZV64_21130 [Streptomyces sp. NPDC004959]|uniref:hypothetical protein n=1 Tax=unclassified Streptomyces TaxID=2593676 RepID=UPI0004C685EB|nr:hypothetical protein [Streptomyces sp. NRRL F-5630]